MKSKVNNALRKKIVKYLPPVKEQTVLEGKRTSGQTERTFGQELTNHQDLPKSQIQSCPSGNFMKTRATRRNTRLNSRNAQMSDPILKKKGTCQLTNNRQMSGQVSLGGVFRQAISDCQHVNAYLPEISGFLSRRDNVLDPFGNIFSNQNQINQEMRVTLVDWITRIHWKFKLQPQTLHKTIYLVDRFTKSGAIIKRRQYQLLGVSSLFIACKYEQIYPPASNHFVDVCAKAYSFDEIVEAQGLILQHCQFDLGFTTAYTHLQRLLLVLDINAEEAEACKYLLELVLLNSQFHQFSTLTIAASSILFLKKCLMREHFNIFGLQLDTESVNKSCELFSKYISDLPKSFGDLVLKEKYKGCKISQLTQLLQ